MRWTRERTIDLGAGTRCRSGRDRSNTVRILCSICETTSGTDGSTQQIDAGLVHMVVVQAELDELVQQYDGPPTGRTVQLRGNHHRIQHQIAAGQLTKGRLLQRTMGDRDLVAIATFTHAMQEDDERVAGVLLGRFRSRAFAGSWLSDRDMSLARNHVHTIAWLQTVATAGTHVVHRQRDDVRGEMELGAVGGKRMHPDRVAFRLSMVGISCAHDAREEGAHQNHREGYEQRAAA
mmetsp:Transcript_12808/g.38759  ORF Transcript_12808/g.38759 Transcript_12808/m.38759 type:complete len:235 (-) Transcript_12808:71-775(-)